jgi:hypothetical protein
MLFYIGIYGLVILIYLLSKLFFSGKDNLLFLVLTGIMLALVGGLRAYSVGTDTNGYYAIYQSVHVLGIGGIWSRRIEPLYYLFMLLSDFLFSDYGAFLLCQSTLTTILALIFVKRNSSNTLISVLVLLSAGFYCTSLNIARFWLGAYMALLSVSYAREGRLAKPLFFILMGTLFHYVCCFFIIPLFFIRFAGKLNACSALLTMAVSLGLLAFAGFAFNVISSFIPRYAVYANYSTGGSIGLFQLMMLAFVLVILYLVDSENEHEDKQWIFKLCCITVIGLACNLSAQWIPLAGRFSYIFVVFLVILIPEIEKVSKRYGRFFQSAVMIGLFVYFCNALLNNLAGVVPYSSWLFS